MGDARGLALPSDFGELSRAAAVPVPLLRRGQARIIHEASAQARIRGCDGQSAVQPFDILNAG